MPTLKNCSEIEFLITRCFSILEANDASADDRSKIDALKCELVSFVNSYHKTENKQVSTLLAKHIKLTLYDNIQAIKNTVKNKLHVNTEVETHRANAQVTGEKQLIEEALKQKLGEIKNQPANWEQVILRKG